MFKSQKLKHRLKILHTSTPLFKHIQKHNFKKKSSGVLFEMSSNNTPAIVLQYYFQNVILSY